MSIIKSNIENLTSLWKTVSKPFNSYVKETTFNYCLIENSEWPNRLWFNSDIDQNKVSLVKEKLSSISTNLTIPYWNIYNNNSFKILEENGFQLKFEQIGMFLKPTKTYIQLKTFKFKKVNTKEDAELWCELFKKSFGYFVHPLLLNTFPKNTCYYIAYNEDKAIGTAILHTINNVSGIHSVGVVPEYRRKGYAEQIMIFLINESIKIKSDYITLQSSNMGKGLYLKLGFEEQFTMKNYSLLR